YALIFGHFGLPEMGIGGAALASVIAEISATVFYIIYTRRKIDLEKYGFTKITFKWSVIKRVLDISIYMMIQYMLSIITWMMFFVFIENYLGERPLAITNIIRSLYTILTLPANALSSAVNTLVSNTIGANKKGQVLDLIKRTSILSLFSMLIIVLLVAIMPSVFLHVYTNDAALISETISPLYVLLATLPIYSVGTIAFSGLSGTGNTRTALAFEIVAICFYFGYSWLIIAHLQLSVNWAWTTELVYWGLLLISSVVYLRSKKWMKKVI
ncbi:MAG: MATE family efflux transporter, partial [Proteiniphilum sp.]|nr:MATE family efflux transporter [Proteiniphilum sp.]